MTLKNLSGKEIKTINGGTIYEFLTTPHLINILEGVKNLVNRYLGLVGLGMWEK